MAAFFGSRLGIGMIRESSFTYREINEKIEDLKNTISKSGISLSESTQKNIESYFENYLRNSTSRHLESATLKIAEENIKIAIDNEAIERLLDAKSRLENASSSVSVRGVVSLIFGILTASGALYTLRDAAQIFQDFKSSQPENQIILYLATRISIALFITFISYFFLSLYKRSLDEVKFYQNELTNIDYSITSISLAAEASDPTIKSLISLNMLEIDRNIQVTSEDIKKRGRINSSSLLTDEVLKALISRISK